MPQVLAKNKNFSFNNDGSLNQFGLKSVIQEISPKLIRPAVKYTLMVASEHATATPNMYIFKSLQSIADECGISRDTVRRHLMYLTQIGILRKEFVIDKNTREQKPCLYTYTPWFIRLAKYFRKRADKMKSRRQTDYKDAKARFNMMLDRLVFRAKSGLDTLERKLFSKGYPSKSALKQGLKNATPGGGKIEHNKVSSDHVNKSLPAEMVRTENHTSPTPSQPLSHKNGAVQIFNVLRECFKNTSTRCKTKRKDISKPKKLEQINKKECAAGSEQDLAQQTFNHARYREANRLAEESWNERARISRESSPEKSLQQVAKLRAMLDKVRKQETGK